MDVSPHQVHASGVGLSSMCIALLLAFWLCVYIGKYTLEEMKNAWTYPDAKVGDLPVWVRMYRSICG